MKQKADPKGRTYTGADVLNLQIQFEKEGPDLQQLVEFLLARIAEHEHIASQLGTDPAMDFRLDKTPLDPWDRVLADCKSKRAIIQLCQATEARGVATDAWVVGSETLRLLALPYADHPDYDPAWVA